MMEQRVTFGYVVIGGRKRFFFCSLEHCDQCGLLFGSKQPNAFFMADWSVKGKAFQGLFCPACAPERKMLGIYKDVYPLTYLSQYPPGVIPFLMNKPGLRPASLEVWSPIKHDCSVIDKTRFSGRPEFTIDGPDDLSVGKLDDGENKDVVLRGVQVRVLLESLKSAEVLLSESKKKELGGESNVD